jgi:hypothetical protein
METAGALNILRKVLIVAFVVCSCAQPALAGETSIYIKSGWFAWDETLNGSSFIKERGFMHGVGIARKDALSALTIAELLEVWGGHLDYDGHDLTGSTLLKTDTCYFGTKEEVALGIRFPAAGAVTIEPFATLGHRFWIRSRSDEEWNSVYVKTGLAFEAPVRGCTMFVKGGALMPVYTVNHAGLSEAGFTDVVTEPKARPSAFAEGGVKFGALAVSVEYESIEFGQSANVAISQVSGPKGVLVVSGNAWQPASSFSLVSLKLGYRF